ncbi:MAG: HDOD domain-containing protein [Methylomonas sp.]|jgi:HD-like signal output (HDOD) protein|uniref:HDOD domain-containing protein n=1 Tax=Methylomonas sp. TaxID=418 RepID=UPI0025E5FF74|nr:HDOD domain-containing protein [Methylomonas sp.]MCK9606841.1 HDOD domain-containing protein [Methylomonas sp.]
MNNPPLHQRIVACKNIPSLPKQAHRLIRAFSKENLDYHDLAKIISDHPTIAARLISLANSAWAMPANPINSLEQACANLGLTVVRSVSIGLTLISPFNISACPAFDIRRFWASSKLVADGAVLLAYALPTQPNPAFLQTLHTGGLLHNLGLICLADLVPKETQQALLWVKSNPELTVNRALHQTLQMDFCEVGGLFAETWGLPDELATIIKFHRTTNYQEHYWEFIALIGHAAAMVGSLFRTQSALPPSIAIAKLGICDTDHQQVFEKLKPLFIQTNQLAKALF